MEQGPRKVRKSPYLGIFNTLFPKQPDLTFRLALFGAGDPTPDDPQRPFQPKLFCDSMELQVMKQRWMATSIMGI